MRQSWNLRRYPRGRPHTLQRFFVRTLYFGSRFALTIWDVFAIAYVRSFANGIPIISNKRRPSSSLRAVVTMFTCSPRIRSTLS